MSVNWNTIKYDFLEHVKNITTFDDFYKSLIKETTDIKGKYFEYFSYLYFKLDPIFKQNYKEYYLYNQIPTKIRKQLELPEKDKGIDAIAIDIHNNIYAVQVKYRKIIKNIIPFGEHCTFQALTFGTQVRNIYKGIFFTNCIDVCDELKTDKIISIVYDSLNTKCNELFWQNVKEFIGEKPLTIYTPMKPLPHQERLIPIIKKHYETNDYGRLYLACGTGKTFLSYWVTIKELKLNKIFIVVPSLYLLSQTYEVWQRELQNNDYNFILIGSDMDKKEDLICEYEPTTNIDKIKEGINKKHKIIVITTYHSSDLLISACKPNKFKFDIGIYDEAHRTVGEEDKCFTCLLTSKIENKRLFMTATEKIYNYSHSKKDNTEKENILSMDNEKIYGKEICKYNIKEAIEDKVLVDYRIIAPFINNLKEEHYKFVDDNDNEYEPYTVLTGLLIIKAMEEYKFKRLLIFSNRNDRARNILNFIRAYLNETNHKLKEIYLEFLSGKNTMNYRKAEVNEFEKSDIGIISSARIFGEGVDIKACDSICFADGKSSTVDIIQYVGRALRKNNLEPNKIAHILIPFIMNDNDEFFTNDNDSFLKIRKILKSLGTSDEMVTEKFVIVDYSSKCGSFKQGDGKSKNQEVIKKKVINVVNIKDFTQDILVKIFDKNGDNIDLVRNKIIHENNRRINNNLELLITQKKIIKFLQENNINEIPNNIKNWIKYSVGNKYFNTLKEQYYYKEEQFYNSCNKNNIKSIEDYKEKHLKDNKLPLFDYIDNGFYYDMNPKFNLHVGFAYDEECLEF
jgi:predicted helicase